MKDTKHIRQEFHSVTWVMPKGVGGLSGTGVLNNSLLEQIYFLNKKIALNSCKFNFFPQMFKNPVKTFLE